MAETAVTLRGVTKRFDRVVAVDDVTLAIENGEFFSLLGPSGCGKTTTLRMIGGLEFPTRGSISIFGEEMALRPPNQRPVNTVFQSYALFPHMSVAQNVAFGLEMRRVARAEITDRVTRVLELVQLSGMEDRRPAQLSGGQQQRVALARALVNEPKVLLLDEPLGALDLKLRKAMQLELKALQERVGITFVYVTHDQEEALTMSDRIGVMSEGRLLQVGTPEEIYERPAARFVADFIGETSFIPATVEGEGKVRLPEGAVLRAETRAVPGTEVTLAVRPEKAGIHPRSAYGDELGRGASVLEDPELGEVNAVAGRISEAIYVGTSRFYDVDLGGARIRVRQDNRSGVERFRTGDEVVVVWEPGATQVLEA